LQIFVLFSVNTVVLTFLYWELISYHYSSCSSCCGDLFNKSWAPSFKIRLGWNLAR